MVTKEAIFSSTQTSETHRTHRFETYNKIKVNDGHQELFLKWHLLDNRGDYFEASHLFIQLTTQHIDKIHRAVNLLSVELTTICSFMLNSDMRLDEFVSEIKSFQSLSKAWNYVEHHVIDYLKKVEEHHRNLVAICNFLNRVKMFDKANAGLVSSSSLYGSLFDMSAKNRNLVEAVLESDILEHLVSEILQALSDKESELNNQNIPDKL